MIPTLVRTPFDRPGWVFEEKVDGEKVDGWRILAYKGGARVRLVSRKGSPKKTGSASSPRRSRSSRR